MEDVANEENLRLAFARVRRNNGAPGPDGQKAEDLAAILEKELPALRDELLTGRYRPGPVRGVEIPKPGGGQRQLGIPNVKDRMVQQALVRVLGPLFDAGFSPSSHGFRPGHSQHGAIAEVVDHLNAGHEWVVNIDLRKFFDTVQHDVLMHRIARKVGDKRILKLIGRFLRAGLMRGGITSPRRRGTPQGGPLSPLLSNILLDDLDKELEARGHRFVRYADDFLVFKRSEKAAWRTKKAVTHFLAKTLRLGVNEEKSGVQRPGQLVYLAYAFIRASKGGWKPAIPPEAAKRLRRSLRLQLTRYGRGRPLGETIRKIAPILRGWCDYYRLSTWPSVFRGLDKWIRRHLRCLALRQCGKLRRTRARRLIRHGVPVRMAWHLAKSRKGPWHLSVTPQMSIAYPNAYFTDLGLISLHERAKWNWQRG